MNATPNHAIGIPAFMSFASSPMSLTLPFLLAVSSKAFR